MRRFFARPLGLPRARSSGVCRAGLLLALCMGWRGASAQDASQAPSPDASFDLAPAMPVPATPAQVPPDAPVELQPAVPQDDANGKLRFGVLCLSKTDLCSDAIVVLETDDAWWIEDKVLDDLGGSKELEQKSIKSVVWRKIPKVQAAWNDNAQKLVWDRPLLQREIQAIYYARGDALPPVRAGSIPALALHYSATLDEKAHATLGTQAVFSKGNTSVYAGGVYTQGRFARDLWRIEQDDITHRIRYTFGEQILRPSDPLGGAARVQGIGVERAYEMDPALSTSSRPGLHGIIDQPGVIDIYSNGRLVSSTPIQPGPYQWGNLPLGSGSQQIELVFRGVDGARSLLSSSFFYGANRGLGKGLTDFAARAGKPDGHASNQDVAWQGWVRHGVYSALTLGGRMEGQGSNRNAGADATISFGVGAVDMAYSQDAKGEDAWSANLSVARNGFDAQVGRTKLSPRYWFLGQDSQVLLGSSRVIDERNASLGYGTGVFSLRSNFTQRRALDGTSTRTAGMIGTWRSSRDWRWFATFDKVFHDDTPSQYQAALGVAIPLGRRHDNEVEARALQSELGRGGQLSWNRHHQEVFGWSGNASVFDLPSGERGASAGYEYASPVGTLLLSGVKTNVQQFGQATWSGTIIRADDDWFASTPEQGPRVLVRSEHATDAQVLRDNQPVGKVGKRGRMVSNMAAYSPTTIGLDPSSLPLEADTGQIHNTLIAPRTGVVKVNFDTTANGQMEGFLLVGGKPASLGVLTLEDGREGWVGESGRLWLEGGQAGVFSGSWTNGAEQRKCSVVIEGSPAKITHAACD